MLCTYRTGAGDGSDNEHLSGGSGGLVSLLLAIEELALSFPISQYFLASTSYRALGTENESRQIGPVPCQSNRPLNSNLLSSSFGVTLLYLDGIYYNSYISWK